MTKKGTSMMKNCWETISCGREPNGINVEKLGVCPASTSTKYNNTNNGKNGGRYCWRIAGTMCGGTVQGDWASKLNDCHTCQFFKLVRKQEGDEFVY
jgi:hypothetical protein